MKLVAKKGTIAYDRLNTIVQQITNCDNVLRAICNQVGALGVTYYKYNSDYEIGFKFTEKPEGWKVLWKKHSLYTPLFSNPLKSKLNKIKLVGVEEYAVVLGFEMDRSAINTTTSPGLTYIKEKDLWVINTGNGKCSEDIGLVRILESTYHRYLELQ